MGRLPSPPCLPHIRLHTRAPNAYAIFPKETLRERHLSSGLRYFTDTDRPISLVPCIL